ncbi:MAG: NUMOD3 domain-containing DNA-binding protein [Candidatus Woesearchaeota archaeon]|nr:NUMOD3 domain-containing DNA-binding protein [Candidatus Woesearchaeota archaeon]
MIKLKRKCTICQKEFETTGVRIKSGRGKYCSRVCVNTSKLGKSPSNKIGLTATCKSCYKLFSTTPARIIDGRGKYCNKKCYYILKKGKPSKKYSRVTKNCTVCRKSFTVNLARNNVARFCSTACRGIDWKGKPLSEETKKRISKTLKGQTQPWLHTPQAIAKGVANKKDKSSWNKGESWSEEQRKTLSKAHMGGKTGFSRFQKIAQKKGWKIISKEGDYKNNKSRLDFECSQEHSFSICLSKALNGQGCSNCSKGVSERTCRWYVEKIFGEKFPNVRPVWLISPKRFPLELDMYCEKLKLAFEFQGRQHYEENKFYHSKQTFESRKAYDETKKRICSEKGITLVEIPDKQNLKRMDTTIMEECMNAGVIIPEHDWYNPDEMIVNNPNKLKEYQDIAISRGGLCLSTKYVNNSTKLKFQCKEVHIWESIPMNVKKGSWCQCCAGRIKGTIEEMQEIAKSRGGECLSKIYIDSQTNLLWKCKQEHIWNATPANIKRGKWCPICAPKRAWEKRRISK